MKPTDTTKAPFCIIAESRPQLYTDGFRSVIEEWTGLVLPPPRFVNIYYFSYASLF